jgi:hypothetical protein
MADQTLTNPNALGAWYSAGHPLHPMKFSTEGHWPKS